MYRLIWVALTNFAITCLSVCLSLLCRAQRRMRIQEQCGVLDFFSHPIPAHSTGNERYINNNMIVQGIVCCRLESSHLNKVLARRRIKEGWWLLDQSIFVVLMHSYDHIKDNLL